MSKCTACNGTGHYDNTGSPKCGACNGTGKSPELKLDYSDGCLWGVAGGQLEYVSQRIVMKQRDDKSWVTLMVIRFTDHDVKWGDDSRLIENKYYEIEFPVHQE